MPELRSDWERPHPERLDPDDPANTAAIEAHDAAVDRGHGGYIDPSTGLFVMTAAFHAARGSCCDSGCRHCPYVGAQVDGRDDMESPAES